MKSLIDTFECVLAVLKAIEETPVATTREVQKKCLSHLSLRSAQRYLKGLEDAGYIRSIPSNARCSRYFLDAKGKSLFKPKNHKGAVLNANE
ncbi:winged helix-turn-helix domain-containing protein [Acinetobacter sp. CFCC 10889]|uniref:winged helix-turn-helix domain-containing protein n=1 Tax=Acinetobacter sp. CFCC 10889 TaxID=1775557 RepID=UPI000DCFD87D|nr:winged helix-turn-helix domain-containing protein [Acinetobacter sp. CFCC 10889]